jgi:hypothetical protein
MKLFSNIVNILTVFLFNRLNPSTYVQYLGDTNNVESNHDIIEKSDCENTNTNRESLDSNNYGKDIHNEDLFVVSPQDITITDSRNESSWSDDKLLNNISPCSSTDSLEQFVSASPRHRYARQTYLGSFTNELNEYADESVLSSPSHDSEKEEFIDFSKTTKNPWLSSDRNSPVDSAGNSLSPISSPRPNQYLNNTLTISTTPPTSVSTNCCDLYCFVNAYSLLYAGYEEAAHSIFSTTFC